MKRLFAIMVIGGMVFASCGNTQKEEEVVNGEVALEETTPAQDEETATMDEEAPLETPAE